jgi:hypothetical protein
MRKPLPVPIYLELGQKKTIAGALEWPGWCRSGRDESAAIEALMAYRPRYAKVFARTSLAFTPPDEPEVFSVAERLKGDSSTDYGVPGGTPAYDAKPFAEAERERSEAILTAIWRAFDRAVEAAEGRELRKGPRGGGRDLDKIVRHIFEPDQGYLRSMGQRFQAEDGTPPDVELRQTREAIRAALGAAVRGESPEKGPRGGRIWKPRYFVRRVAWHTLDHTWEIEDRIL